MATIETRKTASGAVSYRARVRIQGHPERTKTFARKTDAKTWAQRIESDLKRGHYVPTTESTRRTMAQLIDRYIESLPLRRKRNGKPLKDRKGMAARLRWWKKELGDYAIAHVTSDVITRKKNLLVYGKEELDLDPEGQPLNEPIRAASTVNHYLSVLSAAFKAAWREWNWIPSSPMSGIPKLAEPEGRTRYLSNDERDRLLKACRESKHPDLHDIVLLALCTGARRSEVLRLRWPDVDLNRSVIVLRETKNDEPRVVPLAGPALSMMQARSKVRRIDTDKVFPGEPAESDVNLRRIWPEALKAAEITDFRFHDLRHSTASYLAMNGASLMEIAAVLGHKTLAMVKRYSHLSESHVAGVVERMAEKVFGGAK